MEIPIAKKLKKRAHLELALLQDEVVEVLYSLCAGNEPVLHGGTAIWRCYGGRRFSEDLDFYGSLTEEFREKLARELESRGLVLGKYKKAPHVVFAKIQNRNTEVKLEISKGFPSKKVLRQYEKADGTKMDIYSLPREELIKEKMEAYLNRRFIRDIYDVYFLGQQEGKIRGISGFLNRLGPPADEKNLRALVYVGMAPDFREMVKALERIK
ncbi:MAG: nucleotidyl transferase AbiEii/AbiGii toxin family protein [Candidatus Micrarchaeia archaeon]